MGARGAKGAIAGAIQAAYHVYARAKQRPVIAFLSRQSARPFDFQLLADACAERFGDVDLEWACVSRGGSLDAATVLRQLKLVAQARVCLVDGYVPSVSIPKQHRSTCIQVWHAPGAIKKFGYQCLDTPAGRSTEDAQAFRMHCGYDHIVAGMAGAIPAFSQAFNVEHQRIKPLGLPRMDYLRSPAFAERRALDAKRVYDRLGFCADRTFVLYAPTFRKNNSDTQWLVHNVQLLRRALAGLPCVLVVAGHPLDALLANEGAHTNFVEDAAAVPGQLAEVRALGEVPGQLAEVRVLGEAPGQLAEVCALGGPTIEALACADVVITDYSAVALEAGFAGVPVAFFVPDIDEYRKSPGLTIDPVQEFPDNTFIDAHELVRSLFTDGTLSYTGSTFARFMKHYAHGYSEGAIARILDIIEDAFQSNEGYITLS